MSGMTDILMIGLLAVGGYYLLASGALGTTMGTPTTTTTTPVTYTEPAPVTPTTTTLPSFETQCTTEGGRWQGNCCSCPDKDCFNKCGETDFSFVDACDDEDGIWQVNGNPPCCSCPNKLCSFKCGSIKQNPSGGGSGVALTEKQKAKILCESEGDNNVWKPSGNFGCCTCANRVCRNKCKTAAPAPAVPKKSSSSSDGGGGNKDFYKSSKPGTAKPPVRKPAPKPGPITAAKPSKVKQCAGLTGATKTACLNSYAHAYMAGSSNRRGPGYTGRDDYRHISNVEFPTHIDFEYEAGHRPYYLGPVSRERHELLNRFQSNFATMRFSG